jgi:hypothetical protein
MKVGHTLLYSGQPAAAVQSLGEAAALGEESRANLASNAGLWPTLTDVYSDAGAAQDQPGQGTVVRRTGGRWRLTRT